MRSHITAFSSVVTVRIRETAFHATRPSNAVCSTRHRRYRVEQKQFYVVSEASSAWTPRDPNRVVVRVAQSSDLRPLARVLTGAFLDEDELLARLKTAFFGGPMPGLQWTVDVYQRLSFTELVGQFSKRLVEPERLGILEEFRKRHIIFVAIDVRTGKDLLSL